MSLYLISGSSYFFNKWFEGIDFELYREINGSITVNSSQIQLSRKDITLLSDVLLILYKTGLATDIHDINIKSTI